MEDVEFNTSSKHINLFFVCYFNCFYGLFIPNLWIRDDIVCKPRIRFFYLHNSTTLPDKILVFEK